MLKREIDAMPEDVFAVLYAMWTIAKERDSSREIPNAETIAALNDTNRTAYDSFDDFLKHVDEMDDEEINV
jgi:uncharacterized protein involved in propanediol utilization